MKRHGRFEEAHMRRREQIKESRAFSTRYFQVTPIPSGHYEGDGHDHGGAKKTAKQNALPSGHYVGDGHNHGEVRRHSEEHGHSEEADHAKHDEHGHTHYLGCCGTGQPKREQNIAAFKTNILKETASKNQSQAARMAEGNPQTSKLNAQNGSKTNTFHSLLSQKSAEFTAFKMANLFKGNLEQKTGERASHKEASSPLFQTKNEETSTASFELRGEQGGKSEGKQKTKESIFSNSENLTEPRTLNNKAEKNAQTEHKGGSGEGRLPNLQKLFTSFMSKIQNSQLSKLLQKMSPALQLSFATLLAKKLPKSLEDQLKKILTEQNGRLISDQEEFEALKMLARNLMKTSVVQEDDSLLTQLAIFIAMLEDEEEKQEWRKEMHGKQPKNKDEDKSLVSRQVRFNQDSQYEKIKT